MSATFPIVTEEEHRKALALRVRNAQDVTLPPLRYLATHLKDGKEFKLGRHQRVGVSWLYFAKDGILADPVGFGKTIHALALLAMLKEKGELTDRALIIMRPAALLQWRDEFEEKAPGLNIEIAVGNRAQRVERYLGNWDVMLIGYQMLLQDIERIRRLGISVIITDDVDPLRNAENKTAQSIKRLAQDAERTVIMSGTPLQTRLHELHSLLEPIGGYEVFGSEEAFKTRYVREEAHRELDRKTGRYKTTKRVVGYKNMNEFKAKVAPFYLRRREEDLDDADLPTIMSEDVWFELFPQQRAAYTQLQRGVIQLINEQGESVSRTAASAKLMYGARICAGMEALGHEPEVGVTSAKADWVLDQLEGDFWDRKIVLFCQYKDTIRGFHKRFEQFGVKHVTFWGEDSDPIKRRAYQQQFWDDPDTRVCIGTSAMEQSLNLHVSNTLINVDMLMNPKRMEQLAGRIRRFGSVHKHAFVFNLLTRETQEEKYLPVLKRRAALADFVFGETNDLYDQLSPLELLDLLRP